MNSRPWRTNDFALIDAFAARHGLVPQDIRTILSFARRLGIDLFDVDAETDHVGERYSRFGLSATVPGRVQSAGYRIDAPRRSVEVISFSLPPGRD